MQGEQIYHISGLNSLSGVLGEAILILLEAAGLPKPGATVLRLCVALSSNIRWNEERLASNDSLLLLRLSKPIIIIIIIAVIIANASLFSKERKKENIQSGGAATAILLMQSFSRVSQRRERKKIPLRRKEGGRKFMWRRPTEPFSLSSELFFFPSSLSVICMDLQAPGGDLH